MTTSKLAIWAESVNRHHHIIMGRSDTNALPWPPNRADLAHFRETTRDRVLVMGRRTFESLPDILKTPRALQERPMLVLTRDLMWSPQTNGDVVALSPSESMLVPVVRDTLETIWPDKDVAVIGGPAVIVGLLDLVDELVVTSIAGPFDGDVLAPTNNDLFPEWLNAGYTQAPGLSVTHYIRRETA